MVYLRSLWQTLTAAASTYALFAAANWGMASLLLEGSLMSKIGAHIIFAFGMPLLPLCVSLANACIVRMLQSRFAGTEAARLDYRSIAIITLCPIYIAIPSALAAKMPANLRSFRTTRSQEELEDQICPLELQPRRFQDARAPRMDTDDDASALVTEDSSADQWVWLELKSTSIVSDLYISGLELGYRAALLSTGLTPKCKDLCILRARNRFQTLVTAFQAGGCVLSVLQRMVQHLGISPVEAIVTSLSIMVAFQLLIELYACGNYQRPLLIRLNSHQFVRFCDESKIDFTVYFRQYLLMASTSFFFMWLLISIPVIYYFFYYVHTHLICALSALLFFVAQTLAAIMFFLEITCFGVVSTDSIDNAHIPLMVCSWLLFIGSMILAVVATIVDWKAFHNPSLHNWFAWILPHVSS